MGCRGPRGLRRDARRRGDPPGGDGRDGRGSGLRSVGGESRDRYFRPVCRSVFPTRRRGHRRGRAGGAFLSGTDHRHHRDQRQDHHHRAGGADSLTRVAGWHGLRQLRHAVCRSAAAAGRARGGCPRAEFLPAGNHPHAASGGGGLVEFRARPHGPLSVAGGVSRGQAADLRKPDRRGHRRGADRRKPSRPGSPDGDLFHHRRHRRLVLGWTHDPPWRRWRPARRWGFPLR